MCGIAGGIGKRPSASDVGAVIAALHHRGPDDAGFFQDDRAWLVNTRLAIQDPSAAGHQPMTSPDGTIVLVYNGEIYNHQLLRKGQEARGAAFRGHSDTETLVHCWMRTGVDIVNELRGDFAFAVYDKHRGMLTLARDPMGVKPLYWYCDGKKLLFASEFSALLNLSDLDLSLDQGVFANYLLHQYNPDERTPFARIRKLLPGHILEIASDTLQPRVRRYFSIPFGIDSKPQSDAQWETDIASCLQEAVSSQLLSDAPLALTVSGGLDSALIAAFVRKVQPERKLDAYGIDTRGALAKEGFTEDAAYARLAASHLGLNLRLVDGMYDLGSEIDAMVFALNEPQADPAAINIRRIAHAAKADGNDVLLSGTGADDLFSGYRRHQLLRYQRILQWLPAAAGRGLAPFLRSLSVKHPAVRRLEKVLGSFGRNPLRGAMRSFFWAEPNDISGLFTGPVSACEQPFELFEALLKEIPDHTALLNKMLFLEQRGFLPHHNLAYMDKLSMAEGVEMRVPFADRELVALAAALPLHLKMQGGTTKVVLRRIARHLLPAEIIDRPKTGFAFPLRSWVRGSGQHIIRERLLDSGFLGQGIFDRRAVTRFVEQTLSGRRDGAYTVFSLLCIESWLRQFTARS